MLAGTLEDCVDVRRRAGVPRRRALLYGGTLAAITAVIALAFTGLYGVTTRTERAEGGGYELEVRYGDRSRGALATPFEIDVHRPGGFDGPVTLAVTADYLRMWDENGLVPAPSAERTEGRWLIWEFEPPEGETLSVAYDARIEPAAQDGERGEVQIREEGTPVAAVSFETRVFP